MKFGFYVLRVSSVLRNVILFPQNLFVCLISGLAAQSTLFMLFRVGQLFKHYSHTVVGRLRPPKRLQ